MEERDARIDHDSGTQVDLGQLRRGSRYGLLVVVGSASRSTQDNVAVGVSGLDRISVVDDEVND